MPLQPRTPFIKGFELLDRQIPSQRHYRILTDRSMPFGKNKPVALRPLRLVRSDLHDSKVERHQNVHRREWPTNVSGTAIRTRPDSHPPPLSPKPFHLFLSSLLPP